MPPLTEAVGGGIAVCTLVGFAHGCRWRRFLVLTAASMAASIPCAMVAITIPGVAFFTFADQLRVSVWTP